MRLISALIAMMFLAQCASSDEDRRFQVGAEDNALVVIGLAEASDATQPRYAMLWRLVDLDTGGFANVNGRRFVQAQTDEDSSLRISGLPGEFIIAEVEPGVYGLDSIFGTIRDRRVNYVADGLVRGPERPSFEVRAGEAVYLGIWEARLEDNRAAVRSWRIEQSDLTAVSRALSDEVAGPITLRETQTRHVACEPRRLNNNSRRMIC